MSPDALTIARFPLAVGVVVAALAGASGWAIALAVAAAITDIADGWLARRWGVTSARGAALDSWADAALAAGLVVALIELVPASEWEPWIVLWVAGVLAIRAAVAVAARVRGEPAIGHGVLNKVAGLFAFMAVMWALATGSFQPVLTAIALAVSTIAALAEGRSALSAQFRR
jgi:phosphatidylglycerophosphate synthase